MLCGGLQVSAGKSKNRTHAAKGSPASTSTSSEQETDQSADEDTGPTSSTETTDPAATQALANAGLLPFHKIKGNVHVGSGGQAEYGMHKDDKLIKQVYIKEGVPTVNGTAVGGGGYADYVTKTKQLDVGKSEGPVDDVIIPAGYADYGTPKLEIDVSWNKAGQSVVCHFPSPFFQGTGANPYTVRVELSAPPPSKKKSLCFVAISIAQKCYPHFQTSSLANTSYENCSVAVGFFANAV